MPYCITTCILATEMLSEAEDSMKQQRAARPFQICPLSMYAYVLCHKEAHAAGNLFASPRLAYAFNYWVGLFHGVLPGTFTVSHMYNHHKYDNSDRDVYSTAFRPRNSFKAWVAYLAEWFGYASNLSSILAFFEEGRAHLAWRACGGLPSS